MHRRLRSCLPCSSGIRSSLLLGLLGLSACTQDDVVPPDPQTTPADPSVMPVPSGPDPTPSRGVADRPWHGLAAPPPLTVAPPLPRLSPPLSGGTLLATADGFAVASDPDEDRVWIASLSPASLVASLPLQPGDEPGRLVQDQAGHVHVALRRGGAVVSFDPATGTQLARRAVCPAPRGLAYDPASDRLHVACAGGELVSLPAASGDPVRTLHLDPDLRDVVVRGDHLLVTRFRAAELLELAADGTLLSRSASSDANAPGVAWRAVPAPGGVLAMLHSRAQVTAAVPTHNGYGSSPPSCGGAGLVQPMVTLFTSGQSPASLPMNLAGVVLDLAYSPDGGRVAYVAAGGGAAQVAVTVPPSATSFCLNPARTLNVSGAVAVAFDPNDSGRVLVQVRGPASLQLIPLYDAWPEVLPLSTATVRDSPGHALFHTMTPLSIACVSCHPEGGDDGRVWVFKGLGARRTKSLRGGLLDIAPYHWDGSLPDLPHLYNEVLINRMGGSSLSAGQAAELTRWLEALPLVPSSPPVDAAAVARGQALFTDASVGCSGCHYGPHLTDRAIVNVGTGAAYKVPALLGAWLRAPYLHSGCAKTLRDRFTLTTCSGGENHGQTAHLSASQIDDLVAYLETL